MERREEERVAGETIRSDQNPDHSELDTGDFNFKRNRTLEPGVI